MKLLRRGQKPILPHDDEKKEHRPPLQSNALAAAVCGVVFFLFVVLYLVNGGDASVSEGEMDVAPLAQLQDVTPTQDATPKAAAAVALEQTILDDWESCDIMFLLHIAKTGGVSLFRMLKDMDTPNSFKKQQFGSAEHAAFAATKAREYVDLIDSGVKTKGLTTDRPLVLSIETMHRFLEQGGYDEFERRTCYIASVREPHSWMTSALKHTRYFPPVYAAAYWHLTKNVQTSFFENIWEGQSLTIVDFSRQGPFFELFGEFWRRKGYIIPEVQEKNVGRPADFDGKIDWEEWIEENNPLDVELYDIVAEQPLLHFHFVDHLDESNRLKRTSTTHVDQFERVHRLMEKFTWTPPTLDMKEYLLEQGFHQLVKLGDK